MSLDALSLDLDDEELRARSVQGIGGVDLNRLAKAMAVPTGISAVSSIAESEAKVEKPIHRPVLPQPKHVMIDVIKTHLETERLNDKAAKNFDGEISELLSDIKKLETEKEEALRNQAEATKSQKTWTILATIAQYVSSAGIFALGVATVAASPLAGGLLIASGLVGLGNQILHDTSLLDTIVSWWTKSEELQQKVARNIEMGMFFLQMGLGIAGGILAWRAGTLTQTGMERVVAGIGVATAAINLGMKYYEKTVADLQARLTEINGSITSNQQHMNTSNTEMTKMIETSESLAEEIKKGIKSLERTTSGLFE